MTTGPLAQLESLHDEQVAFLVFGAVALAFYGHVRATADLDVIVDPAPDNLGRLIAWLEAHDARLTLNPGRPFGEAEASAVRRGSNASLTVDLGRLDVVQRLPGLAPFAQLESAAEVYEVDDRRYRVIDRGTLLRRKRARGTPQDLADVAAIEAL